MWGCERRGFELTKVRKRADKSINPSIFQAARPIENQRIRGITLYALYKFKTYLLTYYGYFLTQKRVCSVAICHLVV